MTSAGYADRLAFTLPDFTRIAWVSDHARTVWQPRIREISAMRSRVEQQSVADGVRRCFLGRMTTDELVTTGPVWARRGLALLALRREGIVEGYTASPVPAGTGQRDGFLVVGGRPADTAAFYDAWIAQDHDSMGELLGYPACCRAFFTDVWVAAQCVDTTWQMTASAREPGVRAVRFSGPVETNMLWRWMGLRMVSHLPCDIRCAATIGVAAQIEEVAVRLGASAGILREILVPRPGTLFV
jgi:hypothetical protein